MGLLSASPSELAAARDGSAALPALGADGWELPARRKLLPVLACFRDGCPGHMAAFEWLLLPCLVMLSPAEASHASLVPLCKEGLSALLKAKFCFLASCAEGEAHGAGKGF